MEQNEITSTFIWKLYEKGLDYINRIRLVSKSDKYHRMYIGDQWHGLESGGESMPMFNFIEGVVKYKVATVAQNSMSAVYTPIGKHDEAAVKACEALNTNFSIMWERAKMDKHAWDVIRDGAIVGDGYIYFGGGDVSKTQIIDNVNVLLSDEQESNIQEQKYILIVERRMVSDIRKEAKANGIPQDEIDLILSDEDTSNQLGNREELKHSSEEEGKCTSILYMYKDEEDFIHFAKSVKNVVYQPDRKIVAKDTEGNDTTTGLTMYPIVNFIWKNKKGSARGCGDVEYLVPNQIELNKTLARRALAIKQCAYPKLAYMENAISNPESLDLIGAKIGIKYGETQKITDIISYLQPTVLSPDAKGLTDELLQGSKDLAGAGDAALGQVDPTQASGAAIIASRDQAALPLNEQVARYKQFVEDIAVLWYDIWKAYNPNGLEVTTTNEMGEEETQIIPASVLDSLMINVRIDVSQNSPYSKYAQEQAIMNLFQMQAISFEEMVQALDDDAVAPKGKLQDIIDKRGEQQKMQETLTQALEQLKQSQAVIAQLQGQSSDNAQAKQELATALGQIKQQQEIINGMGGQNYEMQSM